MFAASRSDTGKKIFAAVGQGVALAEKGMNAPGAAELRAAGCPESMVMDMREAMGIAVAFIPDAGLEGDEETDYVLAACSGAPASELPACDALAAVYAKAVPSARDFVIEVKHTGKQKAECRNRYSGDGTFIVDLK